MGLIFIYLFLLIVNMLNLGYANDQFARLFAQYDLSDSLYQNHRPHPHHHHQLMQHAAYRRMTPSLVTSGGEFQNIKPTSQGEKTRNKLNSPYYSILARLR